MISTQKNCLTVITLFCSFSFASAQSLSPTVIASSGEFLTSSSGSVSYTLGETVSETFSVTSNILTQGFQQPLSVAVTSVPDHTATGATYVYPNPVREDIFIDFTKMKTGKYAVEIYDISGKLVNVSTMEVASDLYQQQISLANYDNGIYLVKIADSENTLIKTFKIIKQN